MVSQTTHFELTILTASGVRQMSHHIPATLELIITQDVRKAESNSQYQHGMAAVAPERVTLSKGIHYLKKPMKWH